MSKPERLHPAAVLENLIKSLKSFVQATIGSLVAITFIPISKEWIIAGVALIIALYVISSVLRWLRFSYQVYGDELRIEQGVFSRKKTYIPLERIQSIQQSSGVVQRMFGLVNLEIQTAGGDKQAEASLPAITKTQAQNLEDSLQIKGVNKESPEDTSPEHAKERKLLSRQLLIAASTSNGLGIILLGLIAILSQINQFIPDEDIYSKIGQFIITYAGKGILVGLIGVFLIILLAWVASMVGTIISIGGFTIIRYSDRILIYRGFLRKKQINIPINKIQAVKIVEGLLKQPFGLATVHIISAGYGDASANGTLIFPLLAKEEVEGFIQEFLPEFQLETEFVPLPKAAHIRYGTIFTIPALLLVLPLIIIFKYGFFGLLLPLLAYTLGTRQYHDAGWKISADQFACQWRSIGLVTALVKKQRIQIFQARQNPLQRRKGLYSFRMKIASNLGGTAIGFTGISLEDKEKIMNWVG